MIVINAGFYCGALHAQPGLGSAIAFNLVHPDKFMDAAARGHFVSGDGYPRLVLFMVTELLSFGTLYPDNGISGDGFRVRGGRVWRIRAESMSDSGDQRMRGSLLIFHREGDLEGE